MKYLSLTEFSRRHARIALPLLLSLAGTGCLSGGGGTDAASSVAPSSSGGSVPSPMNLPTSTGGSSTSSATGLRFGGDWSSVTTGPNIGTGTTYYVATNGSDNNDGKTLSTPFASIEKAVMTVQPGDVIEIRGGTYTPAGSGIYINHGGTKDAWIKMEAYNKEHVIINATSKSYALYVEQAAPYWIINHIEMSGGSSYTMKIDSNNVRLVDSNLYGSSDDIIKLVASSDDVWILGNEIHNNNAPIGANAQGVDIVGADRTWVAYNYVHDTSSIGIYAKGGSQGEIFENNRLVNIHSRGLMLGQQTGIQYMKRGPYEAYDGIIRNNVVIGSDDACLAASSAYDISIYNNSCYDAARTSQAAIFLSNEANTGQASTNLYVYNNIIYASTQTNRPVFKLGPNAMTDYSTLHMNNNLYWTANGASSVTFTVEDKSMWNVPFSTWRATFGQDSASIIADPMYASTTGTTPLQVNQGSPAIDAGAATDKVTMDFNDVSRPQGKSIDIGAYEK